MPACQKCGVERRRLHRHHKIPRSLGGSDDPDNIEELCANCHQDEHDTPEGREPWRKSHTPEANARRAEAMRKRWADPQWRRRVMATRKKTWTPERYAERAAKIKAAYEDPERRQMQADKVKKSWQDPKQRKQRVRNQKKAIAARSPKQKAEHARKISEAKKGQGKLNRWARDFDQCRECGTDETPHRGKGLCQNCYMRDRRAAQGR